MDRPLRRAQPHVLGDHTSRSDQAAAEGLGAGFEQRTQEPSRILAHLTVDQHANTSAASVPLALDLAVRDGRIKRGDLVVLEAMGGGFTWGAAVLRV